MHMTISGGLGAVDTKKGFDVVERKGIGHPDSLADLIVEEFSRRYSLLGLKRFGVVPNHWVDKVALVGAESVVGFGRYSIEKPVSAYLFGKVTRSVGDERIPIDSLFRAVAEDVLRTATRRPCILDHLRTRVENTAGIGTDHPFSFYRPGSAADCSAKKHGTTETRFRSPPSSVSASPVTSATGIGEASPTSSGPVCPDSNASPTGFSRRTHRTVPEPGPDSGGMTWPVPASPTATSSW